jgi:hypothetical protein
VGIYFLIEIRSRKGVALGRGEQSQRESEKLAPLLIGPRYSNNHRSDK